MRSKETEDGDMVIDVDAGWRDAEFDGQYKREMLRRYLDEAKALGADEIGAQVLAALWLIIEVMPASPRQYTPMYDPSGKIVGWR